MGFLGKVGEGCERAPSWTFVGELQQPNTCWSGQRPQHNIRGEHTMCVMYTIVVWKVGVGIRREKEGGL